MYWNIAARPLFCRTALSSCAIRLAPAPAPKSRHSLTVSIAVYVFKSVCGMALPPFLGLFTSTTSRLGLFEAFVQSGPGPADNIFPASTSRPIPISSCITRTYYHRYGLLISSCVSSPSSPLRWPCPSLLLRLSETLGTILQDVIPTPPIHRHR